MPAPETAALCGAPAASSGIERGPFAGPVAVGAKSTWMVQVEPGATAVFEQVSVTIPKGAASAAAPMFNVSVPEFVTTTDWPAEVRPTAWFPNARLDAESDAAG